MKYSLLKHDKTDIVGQTDISHCNMGDHKYFLDIDFDYEDGKLVQT